MRQKPGGWPGGFDLETKRHEIVEIETLLGDADFWKDRKNADEKIKRLGELKDLTDRYDEIDRGITSLQATWNEDEFYALQRKFKSLEVRELFSGKYDAGNAILGFYPGAGGEDAEDWARMLAEMYAHYAAQRKWRIATIDDSSNRRTLEIKGDYAYGYLKHEAGVHRLVRISPFSAKQMRHTSFALVEVLPDLPDAHSAQIDIPERDLKWEFSRSSGPGGQNVNKVETAVRVAHIPTGLSAHSQVERSQSMNREKALKVLKAKLMELMEKTQVKELSALRANVKPEWGNQIRSYVLNPYKLVKDHRTEVETSNVDSVLAGALDIFIEAEIELLNR